MLMRNVKARLITGDMYTLSGHPIAIRKNLEKYILSLIREMLRPQLFGCSTINIYI